MDTSKMKELLLRKVDDSFYPSVPYNNIPSDNDIKRIVLLCWKFRNADLGESYDGSVELENMVKLIKNHWEDNIL